MHADYRRRITGGPKIGRSVGECGDHESVGDLALGGRRLLYTYTNRGDDCVYELRSPAGTLEQGFYNSGSRVGKQIVATAGEGSLLAYAEVSVGQIGAGLL